MARKKKGDPVHGWIVVDKPLGLSSTQVVGRIRRLTNAQKLGHGGTLDPLATGVLPIALGEATKTVPFVMDGEKAYRFTVAFGAETTTDDAEGEATETSDHRPTDAEITAALPVFLGAVSQVPPAYSAIKIAGQRAYALARGGETPEMTARTVQIHQIRLVGRPDPDHAELAVNCGKGTYIRALARDLARKLGTRGHVSALRRTASGPFDEKAAIPLETLENLGHSAALQQHLLSVATALDDIPALALTEGEAGKLHHGQAIAALPVLDRNRDAGAKQGDTVAVLLDDRMVALAEIEGGEIRPVRVFNL